MPSCWESSDVGFCDCSYTPPLRSALTHRMRREALRVILRRSLVHRCLFDSQRTLGACAVCGVVVIGLQGSPLHCADSTLSNRGEYRRLRARRFQCGGPCIMPKCNTGSMNLMEFDSGYIGRIRRVSLWTLGTTRMESVTSSPLCPI